MRDYQSRENAVTTNFRSTTSWRTSVCKHSSDAEVVSAAGGTSPWVSSNLPSSSPPTRSSRPWWRELFGPVITVFVYDDAKSRGDARPCDASSPYAPDRFHLRPRPRSAITTTMEDSRYASGEHYINDKPTGAVVSQQPFGGSRASGTNDKAGSALNLIRWTNVAGHQRRRLFPDGFPLSVPRREIGTAMLVQRYQDRIRP